MAVELTPFLWYNTEAEEAVRFYCGLIPNSRIVNVIALPSDSPSGPAGSVKVVEFVLAGRPMQAMSAGPFDPFNHAISFMIECETQAEIDHLWQGLQADGGTPEQCGWVKDRYGVLWQIVPKSLARMTRDPDHARAKRALDAMLKMVKLDIATLEKAYNG